MTKKYHFEKELLQNYSYSLSNNTVRQLLAQIKPEKMRHKKFGSRMPIFYEVAVVHPRTHKFGKCWIEPIFSTKNHIEAMHFLLTAGAGECPSGLYLLIFKYFPKLKSGKKYFAECEVRNEGDIITIILYKRIGKEGRHEIFRHVMRQIS